MSTPSSRCPPGRLRELERPGGRDGRIDRDEFYGHATQRISSDALWVDVLSTAGPRIVRLGLAGSSRNLLAETPDEGWDTPYGRYELLGGHRLWFAPEDPDRGVVPDGTGLALELEPGGVRLTGAVERPTGRNKRASSPA